MAQNKNIKNSESLCEKIHNAVSPFRSRTHRISHHPQGSISIVNNTKLPPPPPQNTQSPIRITSPQKTEHVRILHQPSLSKAIPIEFEPLESDVAEKEAAITNCRGIEKVNDRLTNDDDSVVHDNAFSDYISKVKDRMMKTASDANGGGGGRGETAPIRDSFNDKVTNYINRAKIKVRKTTSLSDDKSFSIKK